MPTLTCVCCAAVPHYLINTCDPADTPHKFRALHFYYHAHAAVSDIVSRGKVPIVVGPNAHWLELFMRMRGIPELQKVESQNFMEDDDEDDDDVTDFTQASASEAFDSGQETDDEPDDLPEGFDDTPFELETTWSALTQYDFRAFCITHPRIAAYRRTDVRIERMVR